MEIQIDKDIGRTFDASFAGPPDPAADPEGKKGIVQTVSELFDDGTNCSLRVTGFFFLIILFLGQV